MAALTWREVSAPQFGGVASMLQTSGNLLGQGTQAIGSALTGFQQAQTDQASTAMMLNNMQKSDPAGFATLMQGVDQSNLNPAALKQLVDQQGTQAQAALRTQQASDAAYAAGRLRQNNQASDAMKPGMALINERMMKGDTAGAAELYSKMMPGFANMSPEDQAKALSSATSLGTSQANANRLQQKDQRSAAAAELMNYVDSAAMQPQDRMTLLGEYGQRKDADPQVLREVTDLYRKAGLLGDDVGATGSSGAGVKGGAKSGGVSARGGAGGGGSKVDVSALTKKSSAADAYAKLPENERAYMQETDRMLGLPEGTTAAQLYQESQFNPNATSKAGAQGIAQMMPSTREALEKRWGRKIDPSNRQDALQAHRELMQENIQRFGNAEDAMRAYNGGWDKSKWSNTETSEYADRVAAHRDAIGGANTAGSRGLPTLDSTIARGDNVLDPDMERLDTSFVERAIGAQQSRNAASGIESRLDKARGSDKTAAEVALAATGKEGAFAGSRKEEVTSLIKDFMKESGLENAEVAYEILNAANDGDTRGWLTRGLTALNPLNNNARWNIDMKAALQMAQDVKSGAMDQRAGDRDIAAQQRKDVADAQKKYEDARQERIEAEARVAGQPNANQFLPRFQEKEKRRYTALQEAKEKARSSPANYPRDRTPPPAPAALDQAVINAQEKLDAHLAKQGDRPVQGDREYQKLRAELIRATKLRRETQG